MLDLLARYDRREGTTHARTYHDRAMAIAFAVAAIDPYTSEAELRAIERFRATLRRAGAPVRRRAEARRPRRTATAARGSRSSRPSPSSRRPGPSRSSWPSSTTWSASPG